MSGTTFSSGYISSGYAQPGDRAGSLLDRFQNSEICRRAAAAIRSVTAFSEDIQNGWEANRVTRSIAAGNTITSVATSGLVVAAAAGGINPHTTFAAAVAGIAAVALVTTGVAWNNWSDLLYEGSSLKAEGGPSRRSLTASPR